MIYFQIIIILVILVAAGLLARSYFTPKKQETEIWKKNAQNYNKLLDDAITKKNENAYKDLLHQKISRYQPRLPYRIEGVNEVMKWVKLDMEAASSATSVVQSNAELYEQVLVVTYNYMSQGKLGDKFYEGIGKVTRIWVRVTDGWKLVHEHVSSG